MQQILHQDMAEESKEQRLIRRQYSINQSSLLTRRISPAASSGSFFEHVLAKEAAKKSNPGAAISK
jgi:hypothetical protein